MVADHCIAPSATSVFLDLYSWQQEVQQDLQELLDLDLCQQEHLFLQVAQQDQQELEVQQ